MLETLRLLIQWGGILTLAFLVLLALPKSRLRDFLFPFAAWGFALVCGAYVVSPIDLMPEAALGPFGFVDDLGAIIAGIASAKAGTDAAKELKRQLMAGDPSRN